MTDREREWVLLLVVSTIIFFSVRAYMSPYNQCVRAQAYLNENSEVWKYSYPKTEARVQCAKALGGAAR